MAQTDSSHPPGRVVSALQSPQAVVTYRAVVGVLITAIFALIAIIGSAMRDDVSKTRDNVNSILQNVATLTSRSDEFAHRIDRNEAGVQRNADKTVDLDHRVTELEARRAHRHDDER